MEYKEHLGVYGVNIFNNKLLCIKKTRGPYQYRYDLPGGSQKIGEGLIKTLKREILEELDMKISVGDRIKTVEYDYPTFHLSMDCFICEIEEGTPILKEHEAARWLDKSSLTSVEWLPADIEIVQILQR